MVAARVHYPPFTSEHGDGVMSENEKPVQIEWIRTAEAAKILGVKSTEGVLVIVRGKERDNPDWKVRYLNVGTDEKPRYMLHKQDVLQLAKERKNQTNL